MVDRGLLWNSFDRTFLGTDRTDRGDLSTLRGAFSPSAEYKKTRAIHRGGCRGGILAQPILSRRRCRALRMASADKDLSKNVRGVNDSATTAAGFRPRLLNADAP
jgi:hypothetical protein